MSATLDDIVEAFLCRDCHHSVLFQQKHEARSEGYFVLRGAFRNDVASLPHETANSQPQRDDLRMVRQLRGDQSFQSC